MAQIIQEIKIEVAKPNLVQAIVAKQYDNGSRFLKVTLVNDGDKIEVLPTSTVTINAKRKDGQSSSFAGVVNDDGTVTVPLTYWMLELDGTVHCDISVIDTESRKLTTTTFSLAVERASCNSGDITEDENYDVLIKLIEDVNKVKPDLEYNPKSENAQSGIAVAQAMSGVNGIKVINEPIDILKLENGVYFIDGVNGGEVSASVLSYIPTYLGSASLFDGFIFISDFLDSIDDKIVTIITTDDGDYYPKMFRVVYNTKSGDALEGYADEFVLRKTLDEQIASLSNAIKEVNGIKYITEMVEAHTLDCGMYFVDGNNNGSLTFYDGNNPNLDNTILGQELFSGAVIVSKDVTFDKLITCISIDSSGWAIIFTVGVIGTEYADNDMLSFATTKDLDEKINFLQRQINELKNS